MDGCGEYLSRRAHHPAGHTITPSLLRVCACRTSIAEGTAGAMGGMGKDALRGFSAEAKVSRRGFHTEKLADN